MSKKKAQKPAKMPAAQQQQIPPQFKTAHGQIILNKLQALLKDEQMLAQAVANNTDALAQCCGAIKACQVLLNETAEAVKPAAADKNNGKSQPTG